MSTEPARRPYRGLTPEQRDDERRERLLEAALEQFGTLGWNGTTIEGLCRAASVTTRHFYGLFRDREDVLIALYERLLERVAAAIVEAVGAAGAGREARTRAALDAVARAYDDDPRMGRVVMLEVVSVSERVEARWRQAMREFGALLEGLAGELIASGELPPRDNSLTSVALVGATTELFVHRVTGGPDAPSREAVVDELVRLYLLALGGETDS
jgi:AcrR family transcriptional regulator